MRDDILTRFDRFVIFAVVAFVFLAALRVFEMQYL